VLNGSLVMLLGSGLVAGLNFAYNLAVARLLGPTGFGHACAVFTVLMLASAVALSFQLICAKFVARNASSGGRSAVYRGLSRQAWIVGIGMGLALALFSRETARYLRLPSATLVLLLACGLAFYVPLGVRRGGMQGVCAFGRLSWSFVIEVVVKLVGAVGFIALGFSTAGVVAAISLSVIAVYFLPVPRELSSAPGGGEPASFREGLQAIVFFAGQVVINNVDILLVKHFFPPDQAGVYAAIALVGRVVYLLSWSVVSAMFPISAAEKAEKESSSLLLPPVLLVLGIAVVFTLGLGFSPQNVLDLLFGSAFGTAVQGVGPMLALYAASTGFYSLSVVLIAYEMSRRIANTAWLQLVISGLIVGGIYLFHASLQQVILVQLVLMSLLLIAVSFPFVTAKRPAPCPEAL